MARKAKVKPFTKILLLAAIGAGVFFGFQYANNSGWFDSIAPKGAERGEIKKDSFAKLKKGGDNSIKIGVVTWGGYAGGQYFNKGFKPSKESRFYKDYDLQVEFKVIDDFNASRAAWKSDEIDLLWITADAFPCEVNALKEYDPVIVFQADWSRGGDAIVVKHDIGNAADLKGKKVAVAFGTPSQTFLFWFLNAGNMGLKDVQLVEVPSAVDAAAMFKAGRVDAAVVWSPDDEDCVNSVKGSKVLQSTKQASNIIADVFYGKRKWVESHEEQLKGLVEGWMKGASEINSSPQARLEAAQVLASGLNGVDLSFCKKAIENVRLCTYGDNKNFFGLNSDYQGVKGEDLYGTMSEVYQQVGVISGMTPAWRTITYTNILNSIQLDGLEHAAESKVTFTAPTKEVEKATSVATKIVRINFATGSAQLSSGAKFKIDDEVVPTLKAFANARVRIAGHTDNTGARTTNVTLSQSRATSFKDYLVTEYGFDSNRFVVVGFGPDKPVADNDSENGRSLNRRAEFEILN